MELISKEKVFAIIKKEMGEVDSWRILREINKMPTIENRPKGKWIKGDMFECDQCHHKMIVGDGAYNYCPNCGADMRGKE